MSNVVIDNDGWLNATIGDFNLLAGSPRFLDGNRDPKMIVVTLDNLLADKQIVLGMHQDRREAISQMLDFAQQMVVQLESWKTRDWALAEEHTEEHNV